MKKVVIGLILIMFNIFSVSNLFGLLIVLGGLGLIYKGLETLIPRNTDYEKSYRLTKVLLVTSLVLFLSKEQIIIYIIHKIVFVCFLYFIINATYKLIKEKGYQRESNKLMKAYIFYLVQIALWILILVISVPLGAFLKTIIYMYSTISIVYWLNKSEELVFKM